MTLIKFNIENKTKDQRKKEVLNKLRKIQSMVESDANYTEMVYHIITNASLQKKNMKVNLDHYGNYTVIDASNKIVGGGMFNSNVPNSNVTNSIKSNSTKSNLSVRTPIPTNQPKNTLSNNQKRNMTQQQNNQSIKKNNVKSNVSLNSHTTATKSANKTNIAVGTPYTTEGLDNNSNPKKKEDSSFINSIVGSLTDTEGTAAKVSGQTDTEGTVAKVSGQTDPEDTAEKVLGQTDTEDTKKPNEEKPWFKFWGGKNNSMDNDSFPSFHTTVFNDSSEDIFMEHMKNMSNKKYLRSLTTQELKDIMRSNHMKVTQNGTYYNKEQMVNKVYQFYK